MANIKFLHNLQEINLEFKLDLEADYGQKMLKWNNGIWSWCVDDSITSFYISVGVLNHINTDLRGSILRPSSLAPLPQATVYTSPNHHKDPAINCGLKAKTR